MASKFYEKPPVNPTSHQQPHPQPPNPSFNQNPSLQPQAQPQPQPQKLPISNNNNNPSQTEMPILPIVAASSHPLLSAVHILLKAGVVAVFVIFPFFTDSFFVKEIVVILAAVDFWIIKNVTGRLLVGLRWWVDFQENGDQKWKFQCKVNQQNVSGADQKIFWWTLALFCLIWLLLTVANVIALNITNVIICLFCLAMLGFNLYSYYKCSKAQTENIKKLAMQYGAGMAAKFMYGSIVANYF